MLIDHIGIAVSNPSRSREFYSIALAPLGMELVAEEKDWVGFGKNGKAEFWIGPDTVVHPPMHIAFVSNSRLNVDRFYEAALRAGASDNGMPGIRKKYHLNYYGAFVLDPDGHNIEAVCHLAQEA